LTKDRTSWKVDLRRVAVQKGNALGRRSADRAFFECFFVLACAAHAHVLALGEDAALVNILHILMADAAPCMQRWKDMPIFIKQLQLIKQFLLSNRPQLAWLVTAGHTRRMVIAEHKSVTHFMDVV